MKHIKEFATFFVIQIINYGLLTVNFRSLAAARMVATLGTDVLNASFGFFIIRRIARSDDSYPAFAGYVLGSVIGTYAGMILTGA